MCSSGSTGFLPLRFAGEGREALEAKQRRRAQLQPAANGILYGVHGRAAGVYFHQLDDPSVVASGKKRLRADKGDGTPIGQHRQRVH